MLASKWTFVVAVVGLVLVGSNRSTPTIVDSTLPAGAKKFDAESARKEIIAADSAWVRAVQAKNVDSVMPYYASDAMSMSEGTKAADGRDAIRKAYEQMVKTNPRNLTFKVDAVVLSDDGTMASDYGSYSSTSEGPGANPIKTTGNYR